MYRRLFTDHPRAVGESYREHLLVALGFGSSMVVGGFACIVHAVVPALCATTGSDTVRRLYKRMVTHRRATCHAQEAGALEWTI